MADLNETFFICTLSEDRWKVPSVITVTSLRSLVTYSFKLIFFFFFNGMALADI